VCRVRTSYCAGATNVSKASLWAKWHPPVILLL
jgi:hypothetical protein